MFNTPLLILTIIETLFLFNLFGLQRRKLKQSNPFVNKSNNYILFVKYILFRWYLKRNYAIILKNINIIKYHYCLTFRYWFRNIMYNQNHKLNWFTNKYIQIKIGHLNFENHHLLSIVKHAPNLQKLTFIGKWKMI